MIRLHEGQSNVFEDIFVFKKTLFATVCCSRGWGKSFMAAMAAITAVFELLELGYQVPNKTVYIIAPTHDQVTDIYYPLINYDLGMQHYALKSSRDTGRFVFPNNVELRLISYEAVERMRGKGAYFVVWDEVSSCTKGIEPKEAWESVILPCIKTRWSKKIARHYGAKSPGRALIISTPKGYNYFHALCNNAEFDDEWSFYHYDYTGSPLLDPAEIEKLRDTMDPIKFASEYGALFKESGNSVFYCFDRKIHVRKDLEPFRPYVDEDDRGEDVHVCIDFNVGLQCTSAFALRGGQMHFLDEFKGHPDTEQLAIAIKGRYKGHRIFAYPDPSGRQRKSSAPVGRTDFSILTSYGIQCLARQAAPPIVDSVNAVNRMLMTASGKTSMYVSSKCKGTIESLERTTWVDGNPNTASIDKTAGVEHFSDGIRYGTEFLFPVQAGTSTASKARGHF